jgi:hypothetical protein
MNSAIKPNKLSGVSFIFDKNHSGTLMLDDIGIGPADPVL